MKIQLDQLKTAFACVRRNPDGTKTEIWTEPWKKVTPTVKTQAQIDQHFQREHATIGILTGKINNLTVIDFDSKNNDLMLELYEIAPTYTVETYNGFHLYYQYRSDPILVEGTDRFGEGVDVRNDGGLIYAPPTDHYKVSNDTDVSVLTEEAMAFLRPRATAKKIRDIDLKNTETRNDSLFRQACAWINLYPKEEVFKRMAEANKEFHKGELSVRELETIYQQAAKYDPEEAKKAETEKKVSELKEEKAPRRSFTNEKRFTWGTDILNHSFAIIKETDFIVFGAKRSSGKTTFAFDMAIKNARDLGHKVLFVSLEMEQKDILDDLARKTASVQISEEYDMYVPDYKKNAYNRRIDAIESISTLMFRGIRRNSDVTWEMIEAIILAQPVDLVFIDNLDLIAGNKGESDYDRQKRITSSIMGFTSKNKIPIILIHHYRKSGKEDKGMDELAGSGKIADHADRIIRVMKTTDPEAPYPDKYKSEIYLQKGRGYPECKKSIFFIKGTFVDTPPMIENEPRVQQALDMLGGTIID